MRLPVMIRKIANILGIVAMMALSACGGGSPLTLTQANLEKVREGMTASEVKSILAHLRQFRGHLDPFYSVEIPSEPKM